MDKAKGAIRDFVSRSGHHDTTIHQTAAPTVQHETVKPQRHEEINKAVDREVHQDHYHHTVQPIHDREVLPEKHLHKAGEVQHREFDHRDHNKTNEVLAAEAGRHRDERVVHETKHTQSEAPVVSGEHVHHHVHETVQPVVHKETVQPEVVHTTVPIHEVHHNAPQHHATSTLPAISMAEFQKQGGVHGNGRNEVFGAFEGEPQQHGGRALAKEYQLEKPAEGTFHGDLHPNQAGGLRHAHGAGHHTESAERTGERDTARLAGASAGTGLGHAKHDSGKGMSLEGGGREHHKPSLMDKLNPKIDADRDGKRGIMD